MLTKILIFGKNGQVASNLIKIFNQENGQENNFDVSSHSSSEVDFSNLTALENFLNNLQKKPDFIINAAAYTNVDKAEDEKELADLINHKAVAVIAKYCAQNNAKLIHYSTDYVFDGSGSEPFFEDNTKNLHPLNHYGTTKLLGEKAIINSGCDYLILRISWVWDENPNQKNFVNTISKLARERELLTIIDDQIGSPTNARVVAEVTIKMIKESLANNKFISKIFHITDEKYISWYQFALEIIDGLKKKNEILQVKEVKPIKTSEYKTKAVRPLNSRLAHKKT